jgi:hypothetical protein
MSLIIIDIEMVDVVLCKQQEGILLSRCDCEGRCTLGKIYHVQRVAVRILLVLLATATIIILSRTQERG